MFTNSDDELSSFQTGVDTIYNNCITYGSTPIDKTPASISESIKSIYNNNYVEASSVKVQVYGYSNCDTSTFTVSVHIVKNSTIKFETTHYCGWYGYSRIILNNNIIHDCQGGYVTTNYTETVKFNDGDVIQFTCFCNAGNKSSATFSGYYTIL